MLVHAFPANAGLFFIRANLLLSLDLWTFCQRFFVFDGLEPSESKAHFQCSKAEKECATKKRQLFWTLGHD